MDSSSPTIQNEELYLANSKFDSYDELLKSVRDFYYVKGYGISIRDSSKDKYVTLQCDRGGCYRDRLSIGDKRKKNTGSRLISCPFQIVGKKEYDGGWILKAKNLSHNHEPSTDISRHPSFCRLSPNDVQSVKNMMLSGIPPRQILSSLRQGNPNLPAVSRTIYNLKAKIRKENLGNRSTVSALFEEFEKEGFIYDILHNSIGHITHLFIAHPLSIKLAKAFSNIFIMDCTYKTNKYNMPLLDIIGVSCFNTSFYSGFVFLEREDEDSYIWALSVFKKTLENREPSVIMSDRELALMNAINMVFPNTTNLLCIWHIEKNVLANCKKHFPHTEEFDIFMSSWNNVAYSTSKTIFEHNWGEFELFYQTKKVAIEYIKKTWLPWKEKFVSAWTENYLHFGNRSSSRAEGAHAKLKQYLQVSTGGFQDVTKKICLAIKHEFNEIKVKLASERIQILHNCDAPVFRELLCHISHFALKEIHMQYEKIKKGTMTPCTSHFMATMGLPCAHKIKHLEGMKLSLDLIHPHWRIDTICLNSEDDLHNDIGAKEFDELLSELSSRYQIWPQSKKEFANSMITQLLTESDILFEPLIRRPKGRPPKSKNKRGINSTARDPSRFEFVES
ncbi:protein FAR-RED IMPAIRED RESPONSE 1-like [Lactuca sativa]|uniref:MULE transposase domain-containing protein n=1 Tax=Lactuca sativa TaxID=4236 RepID=A0A9R1VAC7_LACSA|nr:protein FAR-RED IMPAIRED RESPONSE 1-like [Lactuca sativa]KAJ0201060.1 hypothetical protein LSAT_V11C600322860 [Lactuca sativa]